MNPKLNNSCLKNVAYFLIIFLILSAIYNFYAPKKVEPKKVAISEVATQVEKGNVSKIQVKDNEIVADLKDGSKLQAFKEENATLKDYNITPEKVEIDVNNPSSGSFWPMFLTGFLPFALVALFLFFLMRQAQGGNMRAFSFGKTTARLFSGKKKVTFKDVAGLEEPKQELLEVVEFLKSPGKFAALGAEIPKGVLLVGPPGVGKTMLAKAVAGQAGVPFFSLSGSEFVEMFVGVGAARVRDLFAKAKRNAPCVIFIDELDAIGRQRGAGLGGSHDEREQTLNQILVEMDGFETDARVIVLAATNRPDILDAALLRPGRFDRRVILDLPDKGEREQILGIYAQNKPIAKGVDLNRIASQTSGFSGADLRNVINESAILAARANKKTISQSNIEDAIAKVLMGPERKSRLMNEQEKETAAYHEVGHALVGEALPECDPVHKISLVSRGSALGYTWSLPVEDRKLYTKEKFEQEIAQLLGGRAAEELIFNRITTGAQNDLQKATKIARDMVKVYGMSDLGPVALGEREELVFLGRELGEHKNFSEEKAAQIDSEITKIIKKGHDKARDILKENKELLVSITAKLLKDETIEAVDFEKLVKGKIKKAE